MDGGAARSVMDGGATRSFDRMGRWARGMEAQPDCSASTASAGFRQGNTDGDREATVEVYRDMFF
jgi:hypothetical protein